MKNQVSLEYLKELQKKLAFVLEDFLTFQRNITLNKSFEELEKESEEIQNRISEAGGKLFELRDVYEQKLETIIKCERNCVELLKKFQESIELGISLEDYEKKQKKIEFLLESITEKLES